VTRKYPLETLRRSRADEVDKKTRAYGEAIGREEQARAELARRNAEHEQLVSRIDEQEKDEHGRLLDGALSAQDLARGAAFGVRTDLEKKTSSRNVDTARARHEEVRAEASAKQAALARASADAKVVEKNREAWAREREKAAERAEELAVEDAHAARSHRKGTP
jgi:hypothetical protein